MQESRVVFDKNKYQKLVTFAKSPITALFFSVITGIYFYYLGKIEKSPCYFYTQPVSVAEKTDENLKILFKDKPINNVYYIDLILWNEGDDYIDYSDFIESKPVTFYSTDSITLLSAKILSKSREDLNFTHHLDITSLNIKLTDDEALEKTMVFVFISSIHQMTKMRPSN